MKEREGIKQRVIKMVALGVGVYLCWVLGRSLWQLYGAGGRVEEVRERLEEVEAEHEGLQERWEEVQSEDFREREVRDKLNLQREGETVVVVPREWAGVGVRPEEERQEREKRNWEKWWEVFFGK